MEPIQQQLLCHLRIFSKLSDSNEILKYLRLCVSAPKLKKN